VEYVAGVGVKIWTCSGVVLSLSVVKRFKEAMSAWVHPGWAAIR
jgi:hypothetical protein